MLKTLRTCFIHYSCIATVSWFWGLGVAYANNTPCATAFGIADSNHSSSQQNYYGRNLTPTGYLTTADDADNDIESANPNAKDPSLDSDQDQANDSQEA